MKKQIYDLQSITPVLDDEDAQLMALFPARRESALNEMYLVRQGEQTYLLRKDDVARVQKMFWAILEMAIRAATLLGFCLSAYCWVHSIGHPLAWLMAGEICLFSRLGWEIMKRRRA